MRQILFIRYRKSGNIDTGGEQVANANYLALCKIFGEENVTVYHIHEKQNKTKVLLNSISILINFLRGYYYGLSPKKVDKIVSLAANFPYVFIDRSIFGILAKALRDKQYKGKIITFFHNIEPVYFEAKIGKNKPWCPIVVNCVAKNDRQACDYSDFIIALNKRDEQEIIQRYRRTPDILSPVVFKDIYKQDNYPEGNTDTIPVCLFLGTYFPMNVRGILWFIHEVLPHVDIRLQIVGKGMKAILPMVEKYSNIEVFSDVPNLKPYIEKTDFMLLPIFDGSGMKVKTCEALMYGKNIIGTTETFEGYEVAFDKVGACCNTKEEFITALNRVSAHPVPKFNRYSRDTFLNNYSEEEKVKRFKEIFPQ